MVLLVLALIWAVVLVSQHVRNRAEARPGDSVGAFQRQLSILERTSPVQAEARAALQSARQAHPSARRKAAAARKRRKDILLGLLAAMGASLALGFVPGFGVVHGLHLVLDVLFAAYVGLLARHRQLEEERRAKVRYLPASYLPGNSTPPPQPALLLQRSGT